MSQYRIGIDLGGTNIRAAIVDNEQRIVRKQVAKTPKDRADIVIKAMVQLCQSLLSKEKLTIKDIEGIGVGTPGTVNNNMGKVLYANNLGWVDVPLRELLMRDLPAEIYIENDGNTAALAEAWLGANRGMLNSITITLGTGVGAGVLVEGRMLTGNNYAGGELGHMVIVAGGALCTCGRRGCWEAYSSAPALLRMAINAAREDGESQLWSICAGDFDQLTPEAVFNLAFKGDAAAKSCIERYLILLKLAIVNLVSIFQPEQIAIAGGISGQGDRLIKPLQMAVNVESYGAKYLRTPRVTISALDGDAGVLGAALLPKYHKGGINL